MRSIASFVAALLITATAFAANGRVWVQPFTEANENQPVDWITRTLHQSLIAELAANGANVAPGDRQPADIEFVVSAKIQRNNGELRVTAQVTDPTGEKIISGFKATGNQRDLFSLQDSIAQQVGKTIGAEPRVASATAPADGDKTPRVEAPFAPVRFGFEGSELQDAVRRNRPIEPLPVIQYEQPIYVQQQQPLYPYGVGIGYNNGYGYGGYGYGWGWGGYGGNIIVVNNKGGHGHNGGDGNHVAHHGGGGTVISTGVPANNGQAIRAVSGFGGQTPPPGVINTMGAVGGRR